MRPCCEKADVLRYCLASATALFCCCVRAGVVTGGAVAGGAVAGVLTGRDAQTTFAALPDLATERDFPERVIETL